MEKRDLMKRRSRSERRRNNCRAVEAGDVVAGSVNRICGKFPQCRNRRGRQWRLLEVSILFFLPCINVSGFDSLMQRPIVARVSPRSLRGMQGKLPHLHINQPDPSPTNPSQPKVMNANTTEPYEFWGDRLTLSQFNMDLQNMAVDPDKAKDAIEIMSDLYERDPDNPFTVNPDVICYNTVIEGYVTMEQCDEADGMLSFLEKHPSLDPNEQSYMLVAQGWAQNLRSDISGRIAMKAENVLRRMQRGKLKSVKVYSIVLDAWCRRAGKVKNAMQHAESLLKEMEDSKTGDDETIVAPNVLTYTSYVGGLARCRERDLATRADDTIRRMESHGVQADMVAYTSVLNCWSKTVSKRERRLAASRAMRILDEMERLYQQEQYHVKPSLITYATAIRAIGHSFEPNAPELALAVVKRMHRLYETGTIANLKPTTATYNALLNAFSRTRRNRLKYAQRAEEILGDMSRRAAAGEADVRPDVRTWAAVLRAWAKCGQADAAEQAERVLNKLECMYKEGDSPVRPNYVCYTQCMGAWAASRRTDALDRMEEMLKRMEDGYKETGEADIRPNTVSYVTAIDAFVRRDEENAALRAQATVDRMTKLYALGLGHVRPTKIIFNTLIHAWSKSKEPDSASKAEKIFQWMEAQYKAGDDLVQPDEVSLCAVLNAWASQAKKGGAERAMQIYQHTESMSVEERGFHLSIMMPNIVVKAIARSHDKDSVRKAEALLEKIERDYASGKCSLRPDVTTYSSVINCCAYYRYPDGRPHALETALRTFRKVCESKEENPNNITYGTLFKVIGNQMQNSAERDDLTRELFDQCSAQGVVDGFVLSQVRNASLQLFNELREEFAGPCRDEIDSMVRNMPQEWSENVEV